MKKILVKVLKITLILIIFIISFILVDAFSTKFFNTRPLFAKKEKTISGITETGIVYKTLFADVYYCNSMVETYDEDDNLIRNDEVLRYYEKKNSNFICKIWINEKDDIYSKYHEQAKEKKRFRLYEKRSRRTL